VYAHRYTHGGRGAPRPHLIVQCLVRRRNVQLNLLFIRSASTVVKPSFKSFVFSFASAKCFLAKLLTLCPLSAKNIIFGWSTGSKPLFGFLRPLFVLGQSASVSRPSNIKSQKECLIFLE
jgi:hypothetical protein